MRGERQGTEVSLGQCGIPLRPGLCLVAGRKDTARKEFVYAMMDEKDDKSIATRMFFF